jgi:fibronectin type 3 domain-containing protein
MKKIKLLVAIMVITNLISCSSDDETTTCEDRIISVASSSTNGTSTFFVTHATETSGDIVENVDEATYDYYITLFDDDDFSNDCWTGTK